MTRAVTEGLLSPQAAKAAMQPRSGVVLERRVGPGRFEAAEGPFSSYERVLETAPARDGATRAHQVVEFDLAIPWVGWLFRRPLRHRLGKFNPPPSIPWWLPPSRIDAQAARCLTALAAVSFLTGYLANVLTQTITYAGREFSAGNGPQGIALSVTRGDVLIAFFLVAAADRRGRRRLILICTLVGTLMTAAAALSPSLAWLAGLQVVARGFVTATSILLIVVAAEEVTAGSRAYAISVVFLVGALGAGAPVVLLSLASLGIGAWRALYVIPLLLLALLPAVARRLPESRRFEESTTLAPPDTSLRGHSRRLWLLVSSIFLLNILLVPASQYHNQFLRTERGFSAGRIAVFNLVTLTPGGLGVVIGGRLADVRGRRRVGAFAIVIGCGAIAASYLTHGWPMWVWGVVAATIGAAIVPTLGVYGPELFPTAMRGKANGALYLSNRVASVAGLLTVGLLSGPLGGIAPPMALLAAPPMVLAVMMVTIFPETAGVELEDLNPEDRHPPGAGTRQLE